MAVNEVTLNGQQILSVRGNTVNESNLLQGETATNSAGEKITGEMNPEMSGEAYVLSDEVAEISDSDYIPFNDTDDEEKPKKKTLFSEIIEKLKNIFATKSYVKPASVGGGYTEGILVEDVIVGLITDFKLSVGGLVAIKFQDAIPPNAKMNINNTGDKPVTYGGSPLAAGKIVAGDTATFIYNGTEYQLISIDKVASSTSKVIGTTLYL